MNRLLDSARGIPLLYLLGALLLLLGAGGVLAQATAEAPVEAPAPEATQRTGALVYRVPVTGVIEMGLAPFVERSLRDAAAAGAAAVVLDIETPGGRVDAAERIADAINDSEVPVYAFVNRRALSAGALISLAAREIYMRPGSTLGAATPVTGEGQRAPEKIVSAMRSEFRALAEARGLDPRVAEAMVDEEIAIPGVVEQGKLLTLSTEEAVAIGYAQAVTDWDALMAEIGTPAPQVVDMQVNWAEQVVRFLTHPVVAPFLLSIGFLGLLIEIKTPGLGLPGLAGVTSLGLFFGSHLIIGLAGWEVLLLLAAGVILLLVEAFVFPGFGVAGVLGVVAVLGSIYLSMVGSMPTREDIMIAQVVIAVSLLVVGFAGWQLMRRLPKDRRMGKHILLEAATRREEGYISAEERPELVGVEGVALTDLRPAGVGRFGDENIDVVSDGPWVTAGTPIRIIRSESYRHVVRPVAPVSAA